MKENSLIEESREFFGMIYDLVTDDDVTDIDYNGSKLWVTYSNNYRRCANEVNITEEFVEQFSARVSNAVSKPFNKQYPVLEAETLFLRITVVHESVAVSGRTFCIRKSLPSVRLKEETMVSSGFCSREILEYLKSCVHRKCNIIFCGEPGAGKTECAKFFSRYIAPEERAITIEDNTEWHYSAINEGKDCVELKVNSIMDYSKAIKTCLRLNPKWIMLSEVRSSEVRYLLECFSTGVRGITTIHTDDVRKVPDRMLNMAGGIYPNMENDIYSFLDVAVLVKRRDIMEDGRHKAVRFIDQICEFERIDGHNSVRMIVEDGELVEGDLGDATIEVPQEHDLVLEENPQDSLLRQDKFQRDVKERTITAWKGGGTYYEKKEII